MRRAEGETATALAAECFVVADGPLNELTAHPTVGYIKSHRVTYLEPERNAVVAQLAPGQRTPMFSHRATTSGTPGTCVSRCSTAGTRGPASFGARRRGSSRRTRCARSPTAPPRCCRSSAPSRTSTRARRRTSCRSAALETRAPPPHGRPRPRVPRAPRSRHATDGARVVSERPSPQVGRVLGSEHSSTSAFRVVLDDDDYLQLDDLVVVRTQVPKAGEVAHVRRRHRGRGRLRGRHATSPTPTAIAELGIMPAAKVRTARVAVTRVDPEVWVSPDPGEAGRARDRRRTRQGALRRRDGPPAARSGIGRDGEPVHVDLDFFDGRKGGHMSISGISGVATKTSFALFFLRMLTARITPASSARAPRTCACWSST